jgi:hypothetical protein
VGAECGRRWAGGGGKEMVGAARVCDGGGAQKRRVNGGPVIDKQEVDSKTGLISTFKLLSIGSPRRQRGVAVVALSGWSGRFQVVCSLFMFWMLGHPLRRLASVAVLQLPGCGLEHVALVCV